VTLTVSVALVQARLADVCAAVPLFAVAGLAAAGVLHLGLQARAHGEAPPAFQSVLLVAGLVLAALALLQLAEVLGAEGTGSGTLTWVLAVFGALALWPGVRHGSAICAFLAALAFGGTLLAAWDWLFDPGTVTPFRWLLALLAVGYVLAALVVRGSTLRHSELLVSAAGLAILAIAVTSGLGLLVPFASAGLPAFWEAVVLLAGFGLVAYAAADGVAGPAWTGAAVLAAFVSLTGAEEAGLLWWPLLLGLLGLGAIAAALRPARPLPPEPDPYGASSLPAAARSESDEGVIRVRDDR
jgi:hypothetical protein